MPKVTNAYTTYQAKGNREDLADAIFNIDPVDTIFLSTNDERSIKNVYFDWQTEKLPPVNVGNAQVEGFINNNATSTPTVRVHNVAQISKRDATVSGTQDAADAAGKNGEMAHQIAIIGKALKRDMEKILLSGQAYSAGVDDTGARQTRGLEHWITTNVSYGVGGSGPANETGTITPGTGRQLSEAILSDTIQMAYDNGAEPDLLLMGSYNKRVFSHFLGRTQSRIAVDPEDILATADYYLSDFGELKAMPSRWINPATLIGWDSDYTKIAYYRRMDRSTLAKTGDATTNLILSEYGLQVSNEAAHFKIADLTTSGTISLASALDGRVVGGVEPGLANPPADASQPAADAPPADGSSF